MTCIMWSKSTDRSGYGQLNIGGRRYLAHRLAYAEANSLTYDDLKGKIVRHKCDNPSCVNPEHLELGTHADNMKDRQDRNRQAKGARHGSAKLSEQDVADIRKAYIKGSSTHGCPALAQKYNVVFQTIHRIVNNQRW